MLSTCVTGVGNPVGRPVGSPEPIPALNALKNEAGVPDSPPARAIQLAALEHRQLKAVLICSGQAVTWRCSQAFKLMAGNAASTVLVLHLAGSRKACCNFRSLMQK